MVNNLKLMTTNYKISINIYYISYYDYYFNIILNIKLKMLNFIEFDNQEKISI